MKVVKWELEKQAEVAHLLCYTGQIFSVVHRIIWNNQFLLEIEQLPASGERSKEKIGVIEWEPSIFYKNMGWLGDSAALLKMGVLTALHKRLFQNGSVPGYIIPQLQQNISSVQNAN